MPTWHLQETKSKWANPEELAQVLEVICRHLPHRFAANSGKASDASETPDRILATYRRVLQSTLHTAAPTSISPCRRRRLLAARLPFLLHGLSSALPRFAWRTAQRRLGTLLKRTGDIFRVNGGDCFVHGISSRWPCSSKLAESACRCIGRNYGQRPPRHAPPAHQ